ncbi:hypothetical protein ACOWOR_00750 [Helicobacter pylori]
MHARIERDIENDELKTMFKHELQKGMEKSGENIKRRSNECKERFVEEIKKDIEQFEERLNDLVVCYECMREGLIKAGEDLSHLSDRIKTTLEQRIAQ